MTEPYYADEWITLYHGNCLEIDDWRAADALVTDPPYGLGERMSGGPKWGKLWTDGTVNGARPLKWDGEAPAEVPSMVADFDQAIVWGGNYFALPPSRGWLVWDKLVRNFTSGHCELAWTSLDQPVRAFNCSHGSLASEGKKHPTQKPLGLMSWCIDFTAGVIADPFAGSGTTLLAAAGKQRKAIGVELDEHYCEVIAERLSGRNLTFDFGG